MTAGDAPAKRTALADEMLLADELRQIARSHPCREWMLLGWRLEERLRASAGQTGRGAPGGRLAR